MTRKPVAQSAGDKLRGRLAATCDFDEHEQTLIDAACAQADDIERLEHMIAEQGVSVVGSTGQPRLNAAVTEVRQGRLALAKLLEALAIPAEGEQTGLPPRARRAQRAANRRWNRDAI